MKAQEIYLTPKKILSYLVDFEKRLPKREYKEYVPTIVTTSHITNEMLNKEARLMLDFVGLKSCTPDCRFCTTGTATAGSINLNSEPIARINISEEFKENHKAVIATLAHEICHKLLYTYAIHFPSATNVNEVYTDLCTIYIGFGKLVIDGCITKSNTATHYLGYLDIYVYKNTYSIVKAVNGIDTNPNEEYDYFLQNATELWQSKKNTREIFIESFKKLESEYALFQRNTAVLNSIISQIQKKINNNLNYYNELFFGNSNMFNKNNEPLLPFSIFSIIYNVASTFEEDEETELRKPNEIIENLIVKLIDSNIGIDTSTLQTSSFCCPFCGKGFDSNKHKGTTTILRCSGCKKHFYLNSNDFNIVGKRRQIKEHEQQTIDGMIKNTVARIQNEAYNQGVLYTVGEFNRKLNTLPFWLRWIVNKLIK